MSDFCGHPTEVLSNGVLRIEYLTDIGPRIARLLTPDRDDTIFAELPDDGVETTHGRFRFLGGHRLWHAPEASPRTYIPDQAVTVEEVAEGVRLSAATEPATGIAKAIEIRLAPRRPSATVRHELRNEGMWQIELAPWALTMFRLTGVAVLPQTAEKADPSEFAPDRKLVYWPYTHMHDGRLRLADDYILVKADPAASPCKVGYLNRLGWLGYWLDDLLFIKRSPLLSGARYPDDGCNAEVYCDDRFIELETLGPLTSLAPGETVVHEEVWEVHTGLDQSFIPHALEQRIRSA